MQTDAPMHYRLQSRRSIPLCVMNKISEMFIPSNTIYIILKFELGYMFRPCGVIIRPLQFDEAVRHKQDNEQINNILSDGIPSGLHICVR
jgi:hypothetical protein